MKSVLAHFVLVLLLTVAGENGLTFTALAQTNTPTRARKASPHFAGTELPLPPMQKAPWTPPDSTLPTNYVSAVRALFDQGMADPRGCEYREIEVSAGEIWGGDGGVVKTHGWVYSDSNGRSFAVCWNGLSYPTVTVGAVADLQVDARAYALGMRSEAFDREWRDALPEADEISYRTGLPLKGCLLLRLGEPKLAADVWSARGRPGALNSTDPYLTWATSWAWNLFERAVCANMRGDDGLVLASARLLTTARPMIDAEAERRGFQRQASRTGQYQDYRNFLGPLPRLLADAERRSAAHAPIRSAPDIAKLTDQKARIAAWIGSLDEVAVRQWGQPGGLSRWDSDPIVAGLLGEGQPAIEPLLQCLDSDCGNRLTRAVSFFRDFRQDRRLHSVNEPIVFALLKLMDTTEATVGFDQRAMYNSGISNAVLAARFRSYWKEFGSLPLPERWYRKLADDQAGAAAWADALSNITRSETVNGNTNKTRLAGEALRSKVSPSIGELLSHRCETVVGAALNSRNSLASYDTVAFLLNTEKWETAPALLQSAAQLQQKITTSPQNVGAADMLKPGSIAALAMLRERHGDSQGINEYADWIRGANPKDLRQSVLDALEPFWRFPTNATLRSAAMNMFGNPNSPWGTLAWAWDGSGSLRLRKAFASPALMIPEYRLLVLNELANRTIVGEASNEGGGNVRVKYASGAETFYGERKDTQGLAVGGKFVFRRCDIVAEELSAISGFPTVSILWPEPRRDEAVTATINRLTVSADRLRAREKPARWISDLDPPLVELAQ